MTIQRRFDEVVSGRRRGPSAAIARAALRVLETPYTAVVQLRNAFYDNAPRATHRIKVPVISVGNVTLGGTGKTPLVAWLASWFQTRGITPVIVSRGYGSRDGQANDEALELGAQLPTVAVVQNPDRVRAARQAIDKYRADVIILDDGYQHRRLHRDLNIVLIDALEPFGHGHVFPRGTLREPLSALRRADIVVLSRADATEPAKRARIHQRVRTLCPSAGWVEAVHQPTHLANTSQRRALVTIHGHHVAAFCGIGRPAAFRETLTRCGCQLDAFREFPDHHGYSEENLQALATWADQLDITAAICTRKDFVKINRDRLGRRELWALHIQLRLGAGADVLEGMLKQVL